MSQHQTVFTIEKTIPASEAAPTLPLPLPDPAPTGAPQPTEDASRHMRRRPLRKLLLIGASLLAVAGTSNFGWRYWTVGRFEVSTDDAYVKADSTTIAPKVSGYIAAVLVSDNEHVKTGQILARIDDRDFKAAREQARADVESAKASIATNRRLSLPSNPRSRRPRLPSRPPRQTRRSRRRRTSATRSSLPGATAVSRMRSRPPRGLPPPAPPWPATPRPRERNRQLDVLRAELAQAQAALARADAVLHQAELNLSYTTIVSPIDGVIGNRTLRIGQYVQAGTQLMAVVPTQAAYIIANYKETQLTNVHAGQPVDIQVDTFPGHLFRGRVDSLSPASGQEFALLPPDNATGNFTKVVQRIPVKIVLNPESPLAVVLRPGMSVYPTIDTKGNATRIASASERNS